MAGSKPAALPLGDTPAFILARHAARRSRRAGVPVVDQSGAGASRRARDRSGAARAAASRHRFSPAQAGSSRTRTRQSRCSKEASVPSGPGCVAALNAGSGRPSSHACRLPTGSHQPSSSDSWRLGIRQHALVAARSDRQRARRAVHLERTRAERPADCEIERVGVLMPAEARLKRALAGRYRDAAAHVPSRNRLEACAALLVAQAVAANGHRRAGREHRGGSPRRRAGRARPRLIDGAVR